MPENRIADLPVLSLVGGASVRASIDEFLRGLPVVPTLLGLGEPTHGIEGYLELRNDILRSLVEHQGFRAVALETDRLSARHLNVFVHGTDIQLDQALAEGFRHGFGEFTGNRSLLVWLREHNAAVADASDRVRVYGFDAPVEMAAVNSPRLALLPLYEYISAHTRLRTLPDRDALEALLGDDGSWTNPEALTDASASIGRTARANALRVLADDLVAVLQQQAPLFIASSGLEEFEQARDRARVVVALLRHHAALAWDGPDRSSHIAGVRSAIMADNLLDILEREGPRGPVLVFSHNLHLQRHEVSFEIHGTRLRVWGTGSIIAAHLGERYAYIASDHAEPDGHGTMQHFLGQSAKGRTLFIPRQLPSEIQGMGRAAAEHGKYGYARIDPEHINEIDGIALLGVDR